jgi:predicted HTH domain antitoxin
MAKEFKIKVPESVQLNQFELAMLLATRLYERGLLSAGQAADMVGLSKRTFIELLDKYGVSPFGYKSLEELESEALVNE